MKHMKPPAILTTVVVLLVLSSAPAHLQQAPAIADRFDVSDVMIPMRDGKHLNTKIFTPRADRAVWSVVTRRNSLLQRAVHAHRPAA
jgi:predicted acyl esterase